MHCLFLPSLLSRFLSLLPLTLILIRLQAPLRVRCPFDWSQAKSGRACLKVLALPTTSSYLALLLSVFLCFFPSLLTLSPSTDTHPSELWAAIQEPAPAKEVILRRREKFSSRCSLHMLHIVSLPCGHARYFQIGVFCVPDSPKTNFSWVGSFLISYQSKDLIYKKPNSTEVRLLLLHIHGISP